MRNGQSAMTFMFTSVTTNKEKNMSFVTYTEYHEPNSSLVEGVYYNENTKELTVDLNDEIYRYTNVPKETVRAFVEGRGYGGSAGKFYTPEIKRKFGPGEYVGYYSAVEFDPVKVLTAATVGTPKDLTYAPDAKVTDNTGNHLSLTPGDLRVATPQDVRLARYDVQFIVNGQEKNYTLTSTSVAQAAIEVTSLGDALGLSFEVVGVVKFD